MHRNVLPEKSIMLEIIKIDHTMENALSVFFNTIKENHDDDFFHPHAFSSSEAAKIAHYSGQDAYFALVNGTEILGYGMLRGFDQGYEIPSLAIIIHPEYRHMGLGMLLMSFLHAEARIRNVSRVRLKVYPHNTAAYNLYKQVGYDFSGQEGDQLIGYFATGIRS